jgi:serine phosphatase RsbU (regulator of sigma subunit)/protein-S-isoprenylcysteine O-methyltransferase Ste14
VNSITPLVAAFWGWVALIVFWIIAGLLAHKTKSSESILGRLQHVLPMYAAFFLIFSRHRYFFIYGKLYHTGWNNWIVYPGLLLTAGGIGFAVWARLHLGRYWSGIITLKEGHKVITTGPYRWVRHPIYTGWLAAMLGSAILAGTVDAFLGFELVTLAFLIKLHREERMLSAELGAEYQRYMEKVPSALVPMMSSIGSSAKQTIQSEAFNKASLRSERYRAIGLLCICGVFILMNAVTAIADPQNIRNYLVGACYWGGIAVYEAILLAITLHAQWSGQRVRPWVWGFNIVVEALLLSLAILGLTADVKHFGPYRALVSSVVVVYFLFIILSTLRLSPALCIISGISSAAGYGAIVLFTFHVAPNGQYRHFMPDRTYLHITIFLFGAGVLAAAVARQIRQHVIAALQEAETRRKLDRVEYDLNVARSIQMGLLPKRSPTVPGYDIAGWSQPADQTGGDYYDWMELPDGKTLFTIADAAGHGIGPALLVAACRAYFRAVAMHNDPLERITAQVDALLTADVPNGRFITAAVALLDSGENRLSLYSAGQAPMYLYSAASDRVQTFDADEPPLGMRLLNGDSRARVIEFSPGDCLVLVTDGFFECRNPTGEMLGAAPLGEAIQHHHTLAAEPFIRRLYDDLLAFTQGTTQADDITAVVIKRKP